jgi:peptide deformylase
MRSRFAAYALNLPDYIVETTHPANPDYHDNKFNWKRSIGAFCRNTTFEKLDVLDFKERKSMATVTFVAHMTQEGKNTTFTEKSYFELFNGRWLYKGGQLAEGHAPNLVTVGQLRVLPLAYYGEPILRKKADDIGEITPELKALIAEMVETMDVSDGIGLAAPQVHHSIRLFIIRKPIPKEDGDHDLGEVEVFINPTILSYSQETESRAEGCLSIPGIRSEVERPQEIVVEYTNAAGERVTNTFKDLGARVVLHENDHLNGVLFIDRLPKEIREEITPFLQVLQKRIHGDNPL